MVNFTRKLNELIFEYFRNIFNVRTKSDISKEKKIIKSFILPKKKVFFFFKKHGIFDFM